MKKLGIAFVLPRTIIGKIVTLRTGDKHSHSLLLLDETSYSCEIPKVTKRPEFNDKYPVYDEVYWLELTDDQYIMAVNWLENKNGLRYDFISLIGWLLFIETINNKSSFYCHEFCRQLLVELNIVDASDDLISGDSLRRELKSIIKYDI